MRVHVRCHGLAPAERDLELPEGATVADLLRALAVRRELVLVFRGDRPVPDTAEVADGETLRVLRVVSGGAGVQTFFKHKAASRAAHDRRPLRT